MHGRRTKLTAIETFELPMLNTAANTTRTRGHGKLLNKEVHWISYRVLDRWNFTLKLNQRDTDSKSISVFKNRLNKLRNTRIGFFVD